MRKLNAVMSSSVMAVALITLTSACGNVSGNSDVNHINGYNAYTGSSGAQSGYAGLSAAEQCSPSSNVNGQGTRSSYQNEFHACSGGTSTVKIFPADGGNRTVCIFPLQVVNYQTVPFVVNSYSSDYLNRYSYRCVNTSVSGSVANFSGISFNKIYVVDAANAQVFAACMAYGNVSACAEQTAMPYSYGQIQ